MNKLAPDIRNLFRSFIRLHILSFAVDREVFGLDIAQRLDEFGYAVSFGTLYPTLHDLEGKKLLASRWGLAAGKRRRYYRATPKGRAFLHHMKPFLASLTEVVLRVSLAEENTRTPLKK